MKRLLLIIASSVVLLAGCTKENVTLSNNEGELQSVTFTTALENGITTKAVADGDGAAAKVNRCIMEVYYADTLYTRMYAKVTDKKASFTTQMVSNRTYTVAFWADCVDDATSENGLKTDKFYTTDAAGGLRAIALKGTYIGNNDSRDAFFHAGSYEVKQAGSSYPEVKLKRPFAQMNVITTDWDKVSVIEALKPEKVNVTLNAPLVKFNAVTGDASADSGVPTLNYEAALYASPAAVSPVSATDKTLSMDYLFASAAKEVMDIDWKALHGTDPNVEHTFASVPYQRNYRTNIKGALLTTIGKWDVEILPAWDTPDTNIKVYVATIDDIASLNSVLASDEAKAADEVTVTTTMPTDSDTEVVVFTTANNEQVVNLTFTGTLGTNNTITFQNDTESTTQGPANLNIVAPDGTKLIFDNPLTHVVINGTSYASVSGTFSANSLIIPKDVTVETLSIAAGGLEIHGTVTTVVIPDGHGDIYVRDCEGLSSTVYEVLKNYIAEGYEAKQNGNTWDIVLAANWINYAASSFFNVEGNVITISSAEQLALLAKNVLSGNAYAGYTIKLGANIDLAGKEWTPVGTYSYRKDCLDKATTVNVYRPFNGTFDGNGFTVSNMKISVAKNGKAYNGAGLIGYMTAGSVKNLTVANPDIEGRLYVGAVVGFPKTGTAIENCHVTGDIKIAASWYCGGVAGNGYINSIKGCSVVGKSGSFIKGVATNYSDDVAGYFGGIIGFSGENAQVVDNCVVKNIDITAECNGVGGVAGILHYGNTVKNCSLENVNVKIDTDDAKETPKVALYAGSSTGTEANIGWCINNKATNCTVRTKSGESTNFVGTKGTECDNPVHVAGYDVEFNNDGKVIAGTFQAIPASVVANGYMIQKSGDFYKVVPSNLWTDYAAASFSDIVESTKTINIKSAAELALVAKTLNSGQAPALSGCSYYYYAGWKIYLANDIDLAGHDWVPIGNNAYQFYGAFDGNGHTISNMTITTDYSYLWTGLFGAVQSTDGFDGAYFGNVVIDNANVKSTICDEKGEPDSRVGVLVGGFNRPIDKVTVKNSTVESNKYVGAIAGDNYCSITDCIVENTAIKGLRVGGVVGLFFGAELKNCVIKGTTTLTRITAEDSEMGGFIARTLEAGGSATHAVSGNTIYNTVIINGDNFSSTMAEKGTAKPYVGSCVGRDYNDKSTCENNNIGAE